LKDEYDSTQGEDEKEQNDVIFENIGIRYDLIPSHTLYFFQSMNFMVLCVDQRI